MSAYVSDGATIVGGRHREGKILRLSYLLVRVWGSIHTLSGRVTYALRPTTPAPAPSLKGKEELQVTG